MKKFLILLLIFLPLTIIGQELECCESEKEVETYLNGDWKKKDSEPNRQYRYEFNNEYREKIEKAMKLAGKELGVKGLFITNP
mgnify:CR=1 FL=1